jgi:hypothetical protein
MDIHSTHILGNAAVHPGTLNLTDDLEIATRSFELVNIIAVKAGMRAIAVLTSHSAEQLPGGALHIRTLIDLPAAFGKLGLH